MKNKFNAIILAVAVIACANVANAISTDSLSDLATTHGSLTIGDKTFTNFTFVASGLTSFDASGIQVTASIDPTSGIYFLTYSGNMSFLSTTVSSADLALGYTVTAAAGKIDYIDQQYTGRAFGNGGILLVDETVNAGAGTLAESHLSSPFDTSDFPGSEETLEGDNLFPKNGPETSLNVTKDITLGLASENPNGGAVTISVVSQSFHQTQVPEASSTVLLALGLALVGLVTFRQRRSA
jgi:hypothetical protein